MNNKVYKIFLNSKAKKFAVLIDPDKQDTASLKYLLHTINQSAVDFIFIGGSLVADSLTLFVEKIKENTDIPVILFPGSLMQLTNKADGVLLLSLISGRNPEYLIGNHVVAAPFLKKSQLEILSTSYILIGNNNSSCVEYISNTRPIPAERKELVVATAIAGEMIGHKLIYLEAGSGAINRVPDEIIREVKRNVSLPLIVGGGLKTSEDIKSVYAAGADIVVVGSAIETNPSRIKEFADISNAINA